jgi:hypothetical protein
MPRERWCSDSIVECCCSKPSKPSKCEFKSYYQQKIKIKDLEGCWALHISHSFSLTLLLKIYFCDTVISIQGLNLATQVLYHLNHLASTIFYLYFQVRVQ